MNQDQTESALQSMTDDELVEKWQQYKSSKKRGTWKGLLPPKEEKELLLRLRTVLDKTPDEIEEQVKEEVETLQKRLRELANR